MSRLPIRVLQVLLPFVLVGGAGLTAYVMWLNRPPVEIQTPAFEPQGVRVQPVAFETVSLTVASQGTVQPRVSSQLVPEISGPVTEVAPSFAVGGFFEAGDVLLKIDPYDYQQAVITARSQRAQAQLRLAQEEAEADVARREWAELGRGDPNALTLRQPQVEDARAAVAAAEAALDRATRDVERAEIKAPYAGRVQSKDVDIGQFVNKGTAVARIYAIDAAEIRLPLPDEELAFVDIALSYRGGGPQTGPRVTLSADFAGRRHTWQGRIVRTESEIDPVSRMVHVVAEVRDPYAPGSDPSRPPLAAGMFVEAEIEGRTVGDVVVLPWAALRGRDRVLVVDESSRLRYRQVEVLRSTSDEVLIRGGLAEGELVCVSPLDTVTDGMAVRVLDGDTRMTRETSGAAPTPTGPGTSDRAPAPARAAVTDAGADTRETRPDSDNDPSLSREEQIAQIRALLADRGGAGVRDEAQSGRPGGRRQVGTPSPGLAGAATARAGRPDSDAPRTRSAGGTNLPDIDPTLSREELIDAIRGQLAILGTTPAATPTGSPDQSVSTAPRVAGGRSTVAAGATGPAGARGPGGARAGRGAGAERRGRGGRGGPGARRGDRGGAAAVTSAPAPAPRAEPESPAPAAAAPEPDARPVAVAPTTYTVAVAPFSNVSRDPVDDWISADVTAALRTALEETGALSIVTLTAADESTAVETAEARRARWLVGGGYQRVGGQLRITARVMEVTGGDLVGTVKVDGGLGDLETLTSEMVEAVRAELVVVVVVDDDDTPSRPVAERDPVGRADPVARVGVAILPFANVSRNPADDRLGGDMVDALADGLRQLDGVSIVTLAAEDDAAALDAAIARNTAWLISGGFQHVGGRLRITARLLDVATGDLVRTVKVDGTLDELSDLLADVVSTLAVRGESPASHRER